MTLFGNRGPIQWEGASSDPGYFFFGAWTFFRGLVLPWVPDVGYFTALGTKISFAHNVILQESNSYSPNCLSMSQNATDFTDYTEKIRVIREIPSLLWAATGIASIPRSCTDKVNSYLLSQSLDICRSILFLTGPSNLRRKGRRSTETSVIVRGWARTWWSGERTQADCDPLPSGGSKRLRFRNRHQQRNRYRFLLPS